MTKKILIVEDSTSSREQFQRIIHLVGGETIAPEPPFAADQITNLALTEDADHTILDGLKGKCIGIAEALIRAGKKVTIMSNNGDLIRQATQKDIPAINKGDINDFEFFRSLTRD